MLVRRDDPACRLVGRAIRASAVGAALLAGVACSGATPAPAARPQRVLKTPAAPPKAPEGPALLPAHVVAHLADEEATPYFARRGDEGLLFFASGGRFWTRVVGVDGAPKAELVDAGPAPEDAPTAVLRAGSDGYLAAWIELAEPTIAAPGRQRAAAAPVPGAVRALRLLALDPAGKPRGAPVLVTQSVDEIAWLDVIPSEKGAVVLWEVPRDDRADVLVATLSGGRPAAPTLVGRDVLGWQAVASARGGGAAVVLVQPPQGAPTKGAKKGGKGDGTEADAKLGAVSLVEIDAGVGAESAERRPGAPNAQPTGKVSAPVVVSPGASAQFDVEIALVGDRYLLTWTDERDIDSCVYVAVVEPGGKVAVAPRPATAPSGEQALVSLVSPGPNERGKRALLAWEDLARAPRDAERNAEGRLIHLATVGADGSLGKERATLLFSASGPPDIAVDGDGFAAVTLAPAGLRTGELPPDAPIWPTYVRFGSDLSVRAAEPVRAAPFASTDGVPYLVRGLSCQSGACTTLASAATGATREGQASAHGAAGSAGGAPSGAPLALVSLPVREGSWRAPAFREDAEPPPRAAAVRALYDGDHLARVAAAELENGKALAAWVTYYVEGASSDAGRGQDASATLAVRAVSAEGLGKLSVISQKASSLGGVAIAAAPRATAAAVKGGARGSGAASATTEESALAWVARERGETQVYVTKLDAAGAKLAQKKLTVAPRKKQGAVASEASDVAIAHDGEGGFIVAWVDSRDGNAEVYAARVDRALNKTVPDRRITASPGDAAEVQIAVRGKETWLVWSDTCKDGGAEQADEESADIYVARLDTRTLQKLGPEARLFASPEHSRSPVLAPFGQGMVAGWVEEPMGDRAPPGGGARLLQLDDKAAPVGSPVALSGGGGSISSIALACDTTCRGVVTSASGDSVALSAFGYAPGEGVRFERKQLARLTGSSQQDVSPVFAGSSGASLFYADDAVSGAGRVRWMTIAWP